MVVGFGFSVAVVFFSDAAKKVEPVAAVGNGVEVFVRFGGLCAEEGLFAVFELADLHAAEGELVSIGICLRVLQDGDGLIELAFGHVAVSKQSPGLFVVLFSQESLG